MQEPLSIFTGHTLHKRTRPFAHAFSYRLAFICIDLGRLDDAERQSRLFSVGRFNLFAFHPRDHGIRDGSDLAAWAREKFAEAGLSLPGSAQITLLCQPRILGYQFNPISVFEARDMNGRHLGAIYEVHNTFGEVHAYVAPFDTHQSAHHSAKKRFHVSPFFDVSGRYRFALRSGPRQFRLSIVKRDGDGPDFSATMSMTRSRATSPGFARLFTSQPFSTFKTIAAIHFEALKLWLKGGRYHSRPAPPEPSVTRVHLGPKHISS